MLRTQRSSLLFGFEEHEESKNGLRLETCVLGALNPSPGPGLFVFMTSLVL